MKEPWRIERDNKLLLGEEEVPLLNLSGVFKEGIAFTVDEISNSDWSWAREQAWAIREGLSEGGRRGAKVRRGRKEK